MSNTRHVGACSAPKSGAVWTTGLTARSDEDQDPDPDPKDPKFFKSGEICQPQTA